MVTTQKIVLKRGKHPNWEFSFDANYGALIHKTRDNVYRLFFEDIRTSYKPIWIGRLVNDRKAWITCEKELHAESIKLCGCTILFA